MGVDDVVQSDVAPILVLKSLASIGTEAASPTDHPLLYLVMEREFPVGRLVVRSGMEGGPL